MTQKLLLARAQPQTLETLLQHEWTCHAANCKVASSPSKRARVAPDMNWVRQADDPEPAPTCVKDVAKRVQQQAGKTTASVVAKREKQVVRSSIQVPLTSAKQRPAGILLVLPSEKAAIRTA